MYVSKKYHRQVVFALSGGLLVLSALLILGFLGMDVRNIYTSLTSQKDDTNAASEKLKAPSTSFLKEEEVVIIEPKTVEDEEVLLPIEKVLYEYVEVIDGCGIHFEGDCLNVRSGPGVDYPVVAQLRTNIILKVGGKIQRDGRTWIKIVFDEWLYYPERVKGDWYVASEYVRVVLNEGNLTIWDDIKATSTKEIIVNRSEQKLYAYENGQLFMEIAISTGLELTPTPRGTFSVFKKTPSRYMQGPLPSFPSDQYYDLPGVPWNLYFTSGGAVIHGAYWHDSFGSPYSHGCVNLRPDEAKKLYMWADLGTKVVVRD